MKQILTQYHRVLITKWFPCEKVDTKLKETRETPHGFVFSSSPPSLTPEVVVGADSPWIPRSWKVAWMVNFFLDVSLSQGGWGTFRWALRTRGCLEGSGVWTEERSEILNMHPSWPDNPGEENPWAPLSSGIKESIFPYTFIGLFSFQRVSTFMSGSILLLTSWVNHARNSILFYRRENGSSDILPLLHCLMSFTTSVSRCFLQAESESITNPFVTSVNLRCGRSRDSSTQLISLNSEQLCTFKINPSVSWTHCKSEVCVQGMSRGTIFAIS